MSYADPIDLDEIDGFEFRSQSSASIRSDAASAAAASAAAPAAARPRGTMPRVTPRGAGSSAQARSVPPPVPPFDGDHPGGDGAKPAGATVSTGARTARVPSGLRRPQSARSKRAAASMHLPRRVRPRPSEQQQQRAAGAGAEAPAGLGAGDASDHEADLFLTRVRVALLHTPRKLDRFMEVMMGFSGGILDTVEVMQSISTILDGEWDLLRDFNRFLPDGFRIVILPPSRAAYKCCHDDTPPSIDRAEELAKRFVRRLAVGAPTHASPRRIRCDALKRSLC